MFWLFELCLFESFELFGLCAFKLCVGLGCASCFVRAWVSCFGFAFARLLLTWAPALASRHGALEAVKGPTFAAALVVDGRYLGTGVSESVRRAPGGQRPGVRIGAPA